MLRQPGCGSYMSRFERSLATLSAAGVGSLAVRVECGAGACFADNGTWMAAFAKLRHRIR